MSGVKFVNAGIKVFRILFLLLAAAGVGLWAYNTFGPEEAAPSAAGGSVPPGPEPAHLVVVTYFTTDDRCPTCRTIERLTHEAVESAFSEQLADGTVRLRVVNFDQPDNKHFARDYELTVKTVVISDRHHGKETDWEKFDQVWDLYDDPPAFRRLLQDGVRKFLAGEDHA